MYKTHKIFRGSLLALALVLIGGCADASRRSDGRFESGLRSHAVPRHKAPVAPVVTPPPPVAPPAPVATTRPAAPARRPAPVKVAPAPEPKPEVVRFPQYGVASFYAHKFHGRKTANGERYDMHGISAAHRTLPLGTTVRVVNLKNGRSVECRINDRGPYIDGRVIDMSLGAAKKLGMVHHGLADVMIEIVKPAPPKNRAVARASRT